MTTLSRREPLHMAVPRWMTRWLDERGLADRLLPMDLGSATAHRGADEGDVRVIRAGCPASSAAPRPG
jgi:hypothetical protein